MAEHATHDGGVTERRIPFDPDNPVPKGTTLLPKELRQKYYKVIHPDAKFFIGDPRLLRDRRGERDPKRTHMFKKMRADAQEVFDPTHRYLIDEICRGRWYSKDHAQENIKKPDMERLMGSLRYSKDHDMFSIISNRYGNAFRPDRGPPKTDFIALNRQLAKTGGSNKTSRAASTAPTPQQILKTHAKNESLGKQAARGGSPLQATSPESLKWALAHNTSKDDAYHKMRLLRQDDAEEGGGAEVARPSTAYINSLPMPPQEGEVPPPERRHKGMYPVDWKPKPHVMELKNRLQEILATKHRHLKISFRRFDEDHKGTLDLSELYRVMCDESGIACSRRDLEELWDLFDRDRDGVVKYADYAKTMGNDALDERDYFQIAQRKAAGRYNEEVKYFDTHDEQEKSLFQNKDASSNEAQMTQLKAMDKYMSVLENAGHRNLFTLRNNIFGSIPYEKRHMRVQTIAGTKAHELRLKMVEILRTFTYEEVANLIPPKGMQLFGFCKMFQRFGIKYEDLPLLQLFSTLDYDKDAHINLDDFARACDFQTRFDTWDPTQSVPGADSFYGRVKAKHHSDEQAEKEAGGEGASPGGGGKGAKAKKNAGAGDKAKSLYAQTSKEYILKKAGRINEVSSADLAQRASTPLLKAEREREERREREQQQAAQQGAHEGQHAHHHHHAQEDNHAQQHRDALVRSQSGVFAQRARLRDGVLRPPSRARSEYSESDMHAPASMGPRGGMGRGLPPPAGISPTVPRPRTALEQMKGNKSLSFGGGSSEFTGDYGVVYAGNLQPRMRPLSAAGYSWDGPIPLGGGNQQGGPRPVTAMSMGSSKGSRGRHSSEVYVVG